MEETKIIQFVSARGLFIGMIILGSTWVLGRLLLDTAQSLGARFSDRRLQIHQVATFIRFLVYIIGFLGAVLVSFNLTRELLLAIGGTVAVTIGFALKDLASSVTAGLTIVADRPFQVGDRVTFGEHHGEVVEIGLRSVRLQTLSDDLVTIPNNKFLTDAVASGNAGELNMMTSIDFFIGIDQDIQLAKDILSDAVTSSRYAYLDKPWNVLTHQVVHQNYFALRLRAKVYVIDIKFDKALESDVTERVSLAFRDAGIQPPAILHRSIASPTSKATNSDADRPTSEQRQDDK